MGKECQHLPGSAGVFLCLRTPGPRQVPDPVWQESKPAGEEKKEEEEE